MHKIDQRSLVAVAHGIAATLAGATPAAGNIVDLRDCGSSTFCFGTGVVTDAGAAAGFVVEIQESDTTNDADFTAVADDDLVGLETDLTVTDDAADGLAVGSIGYIGTKRYARAVITGSAGTDAEVIGIWVLGNLRYSPGGDAAANIAAT